MASTSTSFKRKENGVDNKIGNASKRMKTRSITKSNKVRTEDKDISEYLHKEMTGEKFKRRFPKLSEQLVKLTNEKEIHNGFKFETGLNVDSIKFNPIGECLPGGIYFTDLDNLPCWLEYGIRSMKYYRNVIIPDDCRVYIEGNKYKADKIELSDREEIKDLPLWSDGDYCAMALEKGELSIKYIKKNNKKVQLALVKKHGGYIRYLLDGNTKVSKEVQMAAVEQSGEAISYLLDSHIKVSKGVQLHSISSNGISIQYLLRKKQKVTEEMKKIAVCQDCVAIIHLLEGDEDVSEEIQNQVLIEKFTAIYKGHSQSNGKQAPKQCYRRNFGIKQCAKHSSC